jgi:predicted GNAT family acetyltransferase
MIDDLFTLPSERRRGVITGVIAAFVDELRAEGCHTIFLGALANDQPKLLYARLGFRPVSLARTWASKAARLNARAEK